MKNQLKKIIVQHQERLRNLSVVDRNIIIEKNGNYVFVGLRRAGKTYFLYQLIKERYAEIEKVLYLNFEDERLIDLTYNELNLIIEAYQELYNQKPAIFFDEIQNITHWEKFVRRLADSDYKIMVTGSNAEMLSSEISTTLGGRFLTKEITPLTFNEFLTFNAISLLPNFEFSNQLYEVKKYFEQYLKFGGLPELIKFTNKREYLSNVYQKLFYGDLIARYTIANPKALKLLVKKIAESVNNETSINRIKNLIQSVGIPLGNNTLFEYLSYLNNSYLIVDISNFASKFVERETKKKYYFLDTGILNLFLVDQDTKLLENLVFIELRRRYEKGIYFFKRKNEVDFYVPEAKLLVQVSYNLNAPETRKREMNGLIEAMKELEINDGVIITYDSQETIKIDNFVITVIPAWKWLL